MEVKLEQETRVQAPKAALRQAPHLYVGAGQMPPADEVTVCAPWLTPVSYHAIASDEAPDKPRFDCGKIPVRLTVMGAGDAVLCAAEGLKALNRVRAHRLVHEAISQGGVLGPTDLAFLLGISLESVADILAFYDERGETLPCRGKSDV